MLLFLRTLGLRCVATCQSVPYCRQPDAELIREQNGNELANTNAFIALLAKISVTSAHAPAYARLDSG